MAKRHSTKCTRSCWGVGAPRSSWGRCRKSPCHRPQTTHLSSRRSTRHYRRQRISTRLLAQIRDRHLLSRGWHLCTHCKDAACICHDANFTAPAVHGGDHSLLVGFWAVIFTGFQELIPIETSTNVDLGGKRGGIKLFSTTQCTALFLVLTQMVQKLFFTPL